MSGITQKATNRTRWSTNIKEDQMYGKPWWVRPKATNRARWSTNIRKDQVHGKPWWMEEDDGEVHIMTLEEAARVQEIIIGCSDDENPLDKILLPMKFSEFVMLLWPQFKDNLFDLGLIKQEEKHNSRVLRGYCYWK